VPYITESRRRKIGPYITPLFNELIDDGGPVDDGEMNYVITRLLMHWWTINPCYARISDILGCLSAVAREFYRKVAVPYENDKAAENGEVYK